VSPSLWLRMAAGLAALMGGLQLASRALRGAGSARMRGWLERAAGHPLGGVATGLVATVLIQSSSITTIATVGLVDAGALSLEQAAGLIVGANVGTTLAAHVLAWRPGPWLPYGLALLAAPAALLPGRTGRLGRGALGAALVLVGLAWIDGAAARLGGEPWFAAAMIALAVNPWLGLGVGAVLTTVVLSSTLTVGVLQRLAAQGLVPMGAALPILFGSNIGTTTDTVLASVGTCRDAQRAAAFHVLFNVAGALLFVAALPAALAAVRASAADAARQVANAHTLFNVVTAALVLPFRGRLLAALRVLLPDRAKR
jgi:phosphate:Na+ symporter